MLKDQSNAESYLERSFELMHTIVLAGEYTVKQQLFSEEIMSGILCQMVTKTITDPTTITFSLTNWFIKIV